MRVHEQRAEKFMNTMDPGDIGFGMWEKDNSSEQWTDPGPNLHLAFETKDIGVRVQLGRLSWRINPLRSGLHDNETHGSRVQKSREDFWGPTASRFPSFGGPPTWLRLCFADLFTRDRTGVEGICTTNEGHVAQRDRKRITKTL